LLNTISPELLDQDASDFMFPMQARRLSEIWEQTRILNRQVWYNRHWNEQYKIDKGEHRLVSSEELSRNPYKPDEVLDSVWKEAIAAAERVEEEIGIENLGPWTDFEWGMINGKLSALRWIMGDDWDMLDT
jgi:hypothetical protein